VKSTLYRQGKYVMAPGISKWIFRLGRRTAGKTAPQKAEVKNAERSGAALDLANQAPPKVKWKLGVQGPQRAPGKNERAALKLAPLMGHGAVQKINGAP